ncbi:MAG: carboxypeptidase regulatory-like domain-containing protein [Moorea sp. SIO4A3]|nr:carboxypeptidase regulatory-like domain-containing protein [Moorena sp. SIO4A3]
MSIMVLVRLCLIFVAALLIACCTAVGVDDGEQVTLSGQVIAGPACPDQIDSSGCEDQPVESAVLIVRDSEGQEVTRVTSDANGQFSVQLQPGRYYLEPMPVQGLLGTPGELEIVVEQMSVAPITIEYDTGIRSITSPPLTE